MRRPESSEYASYYGGYVDRVPEADVLAALERQPDELRSLCARFAGERERFRYAPGKWSVREVFGHLADSERVFGYRAFCFARAERAPLPSFDENEYAAASGADQRPLAEIVEELALLRAANLAFLRRLDAAGWDRVGTASQNPISVRALAYVMAGHPRHHAAVLQERYLAP
ncbi:MAG: DinB family protein [Vicinamibacteria bacterium]